MIKLYRKYIIASLTVMVFVTGMCTNVFSQTIVATWDGPPIKIDVEYLNAEIAAYNDEYNQNYPLWPIENWPIELKELEDGELVELLFSKDTYVVTKAGTTSSLIRVEAGEEFIINTGDDKDISGYGIPDSSIMWLLGTSLLLLGLLSRKKKA